MTQAEAESSRRRTEAQAIIQAQTGIDEPMIQALIHGFYARIRDDALLGPIFDAHIHDWPLHLERMCQFWSSVMLMSGQYHGQPLPRHMPLPIDARHFDHWLALFETTASEMCPPKAADHFNTRARRIAESLELGIASGRGILLTKGQRLRQPES